MEIIPFFCNFVPILPPCILKTEGLGGRDYTKAFTSFILVGQKPGSLETTVKNIAK